MSRRQPAMVSRMILSSQRLSFRPRGRLAAPSALALIVAASLAGPAWAQTQPLPTVPSTPQPPYETQPEQTAPAPAPATPVPAQDSQPDAESALPSPATETLGDPPPPDIAPAPMGQTAAPGSQTPAAPVTGQAVAPAPNTGTVTRILVRGNQRVDQTTILSYLPIQPGDTVDPVTLDVAVRTLQRTQLFSNVQIGLQNGDLIGDQPGGVRRQFGPERGAAA